MSKICKGKLKNDWDHKEIVIGNRGANWMNWGWFLYSQTDRYGERDDFVATINIKEENCVHDVVPFEYYNSLIKTEINERKTFKNK